MVLRASHQALGCGNRSNPLFDLGAWIYWDCRWGRATAQERSSPRTPVAVYNGGVPLADPYCVFDHGTGRFVENAGGGTVWPIDGHFSPGRGNYYNASRPASSASRGPMTPEAGLTLTALPVASSPNHILESLIPVVTVPRITNSTGGWRRWYRQEQRSAAWKREWSMVMKRMDGGKIDATVAALGASDLADPLGADISVRATTYKKIREDGWYLLTTYVNTDAGPADCYYWATCADGTDLIYECPQTESFGASIDDTTQPIMNQALVSNTRGGMATWLENTDTYNLPQSGWMACSITPRNDACLAPAVPPAVEYPTSTILRWYKTAGSATDYHQIYISNTLQVLAYQCYFGGATQAFLQTTVADVAQGMPLGFVGAWSYRDGATNFIGCLNGSIYEVDVLGTLPSGTSKISLGCNPAGSDPANVNIWAVALGNKAITRYDAALISRYMYNRAQVGCMSPTGA